MPPELIEMYGRYEKYGVEPRLEELMIFLDWYTTTPIFGYVSTHWTSSVLMVKMT